MESAGIGLGHAVVLLAAAVIAVPLFRKLGLGAVLGYLCAGLLIGPFGLAFFHDPQAILHDAQFSDVQDRFGLVEERQPERPDQQARDEIAQHRTEAELAKQRDRDDGGRQQDDRMAETDACRFRGQARLRRVPDR